MRLDWSAGAISLLLLSLWTLRSASAAYVNVSIDDQYGDPMTGVQFLYLPDGPWHIGENCSICMAHPAPGQVYQGTWHDGTFNSQRGNFPNQVLTASVAFNGFAVYVYCILAPTTVSLDGNTDMEFFIDSQSVGNFSLPPNNNTGYTYDYPVFATDQLQPGNHTFTLQNGREGGQKALVLLDYITYTYDEASPNSTPSSSPTTPSSSLSSTQRRPDVGVIVGAVVGSVGGVCLIGLGFVFFRRYQQRRRRDIDPPPDLSIEPFGIRPPPRMPDIYVTRNWVNEAAMGDGPPSVGAFPSSKSLANPQPASEPAIPIPRTSINPPASVTSTNPQPDTSFLSMRGVPLTEDPRSRALPPLSPPDGSRTRRRPAIEGVASQEPGSQPHQLGLQAFQRVFNPFRRGNIQVEDPPNYDSSAERGHRRNKSSRRNG